MNQKIIETLVNLMLEIEQKRSLTGKQKKELVLHYLKNKIELNNEIEEIILDIIDYLILVDKRKIKIRGAKFCKFFC